MQIARIRPYFDIVEDLRHDEGDTNGIMVVKDICILTTVQEMEVSEEE